MYGTLVCNLSMINARTSVSEAYFFTCSIYDVRSTKYDSPRDRQMSMLLLARWRLFSRKLQSTAIVCRYRYLFSGGAVTQSSGKLIPGCGHARQRTANSPGAVFEIPSGKCPRPARMKAFKFLHSRTMFASAWRRSYYHKTIYELRIMWKV